MSQQPNFQAGPSTPGPPSIRRPQGARKRGIAPGLFIANPDNSDDDGSSPKSGSQRSPARFSPTVASSSSSNKSTAVPIPLQQASPTTEIGHAATLPPNLPAPMPTIPAPQSSPLPHITAFSSPSIPTSASQMDPPRLVSPSPPQPPPQPERHLRRAMTTPAVEGAVARFHESRSSSGSTAKLPPHPQSPPRALPALPSPPVRPTLPSPQSTSSSIAQITPLAAPQPTPLTPVGQPEGSNRSLQQFQHRVNSPEDVMSPTGQSEGGMSSLSSSEFASRARSGSLAGKSVRLQVTTDNEQFTLVDITGMQTAEAIKERVFSKLRFRDDDYPTLSLYRTEIGEAPEALALSNEALLHLCSSIGDARATLKFLVIHTSVPESASATFIPPIPGEEQANLRGIPPIHTNLSQQSLHAPQRTPSRHSRDGSLSSASEIMERRGGSTSDWSEIGHEEARDWHAPTGHAKVHRSARSMRHPRGRKMGSSTGSSRSPLTDPLIERVSPTRPAVTEAMRSVSSLPSPGSRSNLELTYPQSPADRNTPQSRNATAPERPPSAPRNESSASSHRPSPPASSRNTGRNFDLDGMDPGTRALIEQFQREEEDARREAERKRLRQLEADGELARKEQQSERDVWQYMQRMQLEERRRQQEQIVRDESRARELEEEDRTLEDQRQRLDAQHAARTAWEAEQREHQTDQGPPDRYGTFAADRREREIGFRNQIYGPGREGNPGNLPTSANRQASTPYPGRRPSDPPADAARAHQYPATNPMFDQQGFRSPPPQFSAEVPPSSYIVPSSRRASGFPSSPYEEASHTRDRLQDPRLRQMDGRMNTHPGQRLAITPNVNTHAQASRNAHQASYRDRDLQPLQAIRSMGNLRPGEIAPVSRPPYQGIPNVSSANSAPDQRSYSTSSGYRSPSLERGQDGRYPEPQSVSHRAPRIDTGIIPFPSPAPRGSGTWSAGYSPAASPISTLGHGNNEPQSWERQPGLPRPKTVYYEQSPPPESPRSGTLPPRPSSLHSQTSPIIPRTGGDVTTEPPPYNHWRHRSGSASASYRDPAHIEGRRASDSSAVFDEDESTLLPYANARTSPEQAWLRSNRLDASDTVSIAGTISSGFSEATLRGRPVSDDAEEDDSANTARAGDWAQRLNAMIDANDDEASLFLSGPNPPMPREQLTSPTRPKITVHTGDPMSSDEHLNSAMTPSEGSTTDTDTGRSITRAKSFARPKDAPEQWHIRPEPEQLYAALDDFFPKVDLDKPIVEGELSTPSTPATESPAQNAPPVHPSRQPPTPRSEAPPRPPPQHPARSTFNKAENRKSIRVMADYKRRTLQRESRDISGHRDVFAIRTEAAKKPERRKSASMWGHRVVEVTSKLLNGQLPSSVPESPGEDKPQTLTWVKGELIGKGSYGRVYIALNVTTGDMIAVKQVELPATERDRNDKRQLGMIEALRSEIELLQDLYHPNIVAYLGFETSPQYLSIFLEYVPGGTIASIYRAPNAPNKGRFEEQLVKFFTAQILEGLSYLHSKHIWHRDLKGDNILVDAAGVCKISDFGISKKASDAYGSGAEATSMKGSVYWMAPEVIHAATARTYSGKVDIWSVGCVVMEMWTGQRPWGKLEQVAAMYEMFHDRSRPPLPEDIHLSDIALDFMNDKCMAKDPRDRPMASELLKHQFITERDPNWTFAASKIGKAVAKRVPKSIKPSPA